MGMEVVDNNKMILDFIDKHSNSHDLPIMSQIINAIHSNDISKLFVFTLDYNDIEKDIRDYILNLLDFNKVSKIFSDNIKKVVARENREFYNKIVDLNIKIRLKNFLYDSNKNEFPNLVPIRSLNSSRMGSYVCFRGVIRNIEIPKGSIRKIKFRCLNCDELMTFDFNDLDDGFDGKQCRFCSGDEGKNLEAVVIPGSSTDIQILTVEEFTHDSESDTSSVAVIIDGDLANRFNLGDPVVITGNIRFDVYNDAVVNQLKKKQTDLKYYKYLSSYGGAMNGIDVGFFIEANYMEKINDTNIIFNNITDEELEQIQEMRKDPHLVEKMVQSFAPHIYGNEIEKEVLIYQHIGGLGRSRDETLDKRGEINVFFLGDSGTAKTELMKWSMGIAYKAIRVNAGSITEAGLTGGADRAQLTGNWVLTAGAAVIADKGMLGIDEFIHGPDDVIKALNHIMEDQKVIITKIKKGSFNTRVSVLATSNPPDGNRYNKKKSFMENIGINVASFTRFDYIGLFRDIPNPEIDEPKIDRIIQTYKKTIDVPYSRDLVAKYIFYMKNQNIIPLLTPEAEAALKKFYIKLRTLDMNENIKNPEEQEHVSVTLRQFETLIRFAFAHAILYGKDIVDESDTEAAERIVVHMLNTIGIDPDTGKVDASILHGSKSANQMSMDTTFFTLLERMAQSFQNSVDYDIFVSELRKQDRWRPDDITESKLNARIKRYEEQQHIIIVNGNISLRKNVQSSRVN